MLLTRWIVRTLAGAMLALLPAAFPASAATDTPASTLSEALIQRLAAKGFMAGSHLYIRVFKADFQLEVWMRKGDRFELFEAYPICYWSGTLGPKLQEGDRQAPEGFYAVGPNQIHRSGRWPRSLNIGYPNALDLASARTGSLILVHGGCTSTGCFAMTNPVMEEIYVLAEEALQKGQERIPVHVFPFRMTEANLVSSAATHHEWQAFWRDLKPAYDLFEHTRLPPRVGICNKRYVATAGDPAGVPIPPADVPYPCAESEGGGAMPIVTAATEEAAQTAEAKPNKAVSKRRHASAVRKVRKARQAYAAARRARLAARASQQIETSSTRDSGPVN